MRGQRHAVQAGNGDLADFQGPDQSLGEGVAAAHQHQHVARGQRAALALQQLAAVGLRGNPVRDGFGVALDGVADIA